MLGRHPKSIPYGRQRISLLDRIRVFDAVGGDMVTQGLRVDKFEADLAEFVGARYAVAFSSGTAALHAAAAAGGANPDWQALVPNLTFVASANAPRYLGAEVVIGDIAAKDWNLDPVAIDHTIQMILPVHFAGLPANLDDQAYRDTRAVIIEDAAHAFGARTAHGMVGNCAFSDMTCFSFHPVKSITTGEGGAVTTNSETYAASLRLFRNHGVVRSSGPADWQYDISELGYNYRITDFQAALGSSQLLKVKSYIERRGTIADLYRQKLSGVPDLELPPMPPPGSTHAYHLFPILVPNRDEVATRLRRAGIMVQVHYPSLRSLTLNAGCRSASGGLETSTAITDKILSLPVWPGLRRRQQLTVVEQLLRAMD